MDIYMIAIMFQRLLLITSPYKSYVLFGKGERIMARYIDADDFMTRIISKYHCNPSLDGGGNNYGYLRLEIDEQPTVDVCPERHAEWVLDNGRFKCSNCNASIDDPDGFSYCPHCGANINFEGEQ